jgi:hypothetical protein
VSSRVVRPPGLLAPAFVSVAAAVLVLFVGGGLFLPIIPRFVVGPQGLDAASVGIALGSFSLSSIVLRPFAGRLADLAVAGVPPDERGAVVGTTSLFLDAAFRLAPAALGWLTGITGTRPRFSCERAWRRSEPWPSGSVRARGAQASRRPAVTSPSTASILSPRGGPSSGSSKPAGESSLAFGRVDSTIGDLANLLGARVAKAIKFRLTFSDWAVGSHRRNCILRGLGSPA